MPRQWRWTFFCGHVSVGGEELSDACPICGERDLVRKEPADVGTRITLPVHPGDTCPTCARRVPHEKKASSPSTKPLAYRAPLDEWEAHLEVIDAVAELLGIKQEKFHRYKAISYAMAAVLQHGLRVDG
jgi:hypothetical protein